MYGRASVSQSYGNPVQLGVSLLSLWVMPAAKPPNGLLCACRVGGSRDLRWKLELGGRDALIQLQAIVTPAQMGYAYFLRTHTCLFLRAHGRAPMHVSALNGSAHYAHMQMGDTQARWAGYSCTVC